MRITGGRWSGRQIQLPRGPRIRPTQDRVRQALFNLLGEAMEEAKALDLFCGSGAMGLEALSRGARHVTFVDHSPFCIQAVQANLKALGVMSGVRLIRADALTAIRRLAPHLWPDQSGVSTGKHLPHSGRCLSAKGAGLARQGERFDLVLLDPPYGRPATEASAGRDLARKSLIALGRYAIISPTAWVVLEHDKRDPVFEELVTQEGRLVSQRCERYGDTALTFYLRQ